MKNGKVCKTRRMYSESCVSPAGRQLSDIVGGLLTTGPRRIKQSFFFHCQTTEGGLTRPAGTRDRKFKETGTMTENNAN